MTSTVTLYLKCLVEKDKNFIIDKDGEQDIEAYLSTLSSTVISNFQYVKQGLSISIKIDKSQTALNMGDGASDLNYCKIQNGTENPCYYFIVSKNWKSQNTVELVLAMDTLNTFIYNDDYSISDKTLVHRMHKDRFETILNRTYNFSYTGYNHTEVFTDIEFANSMPANIIATCSDISVIFTIATPIIDGQRHIRVKCTSGTMTTKDITVTYDVKALRRVIDLKSEEIIAPVYKTNEFILYDSKSPIQNWSLYYRTADDQSGTPIDCYLLPSDPVEIYYPQAGGTLDNNNVPTGKYLVFSSTFPSGDVTIQYGSKTISTKAGDIPQLYEELLAVFNDAGTLKLYKGKFVRSQYISGIFWSTEIWSGASLTVLNASTTYIDSYETNTLPTYLTWQTVQFNGYNHSTSMGTIDVGTLYSLDDVDKTLKENIKIINIPYSPTPYNVDGSNIFTFDSCWQFNTGDGRVKLIDFTKRFNNTVETEQPNFMSDFIQNFHQNFNPNEDISRRDFDPKLYHSDFYRPKFVYDSFSKIFPLEEVNYDNSSKEIYFKFNFVMSRNIVSKFLFKFNQIKYRHSKEDYEDIVAVSRNNEEVLYNSQYLDYIRTGYNYDLKAKERSETASGIGIGLNAASLVGSIALGAMSGNPIGWAGAFASGVGLVSQLINYAKNVSQNEENIQKKLQESQMQAISVLNADDYDLLYAYTENKAKTCWYKVSQQMKNVLEDLFHYCGYKIEEQMKPVIDSRRSFNFVQATLVIDATNNLTNEIVEDINQKFENGVTFLHYSFNKWDFKQDKENFEIKVLEELEDAGLLN